MLRKRNFTTSKEIYVFLLKKEKNILWTSMKIELQITKHFGKQLNCFFPIDLSTEKESRQLKKINCFHKGKWLEIRLINFFSIIALNLKIPEFQAGNTFYQKIKINPILKAIMKYMDNPSAVATV